MKKTGLFLAALLLIVTTAQASETVTDETSKNGITKRYRHVKPIQFVERGIVFFVYPNGTFDYESSRTVNRPNRRGGIYANINAPGFQVSYNTALRNNRRGLNVQRDWNGRIRSVGNVSISYSRYGKVNRIGKVQMRYHRGQLERVGGLKLHYGRNGNLIRISGSVNHYNSDCGICGTANCTMNHFEDNNYDNRYNDDHHYDDYDDDYDNDYNYKKAKKYKKNKKYNKNDRERSRY
jgi:hypothetical protein